MARLRFSRAKRIWTRRLESWRSRRTTWAWPGRPCIEWGHRRGMLPTQYPTREILSTVRQTSIRALRLGVAPTSFRPTLTEKRSVELHSRYFVSYISPIARAYQAEGFSPAV